MFKSSLLLFFFLSVLSVRSQDFRILVFSKTAGYRHTSIETGIAALKKLGNDNNFLVESTEDASAFNLTKLNNFAAVVFLSTTGDVLNPEQQAEFEKYIKQGGGYVGIHAASDTEYEWPWYGNLVGAFFKSHPAIQNANIKVADHVHPSTQHLPYNWVRKDEWYDYKSNPRGNVHVLATLDEKSYTGGTMGIDHPIAWCHSFDGGRAFYTGGGHTNESYSEPDFLKHILGGIKYAAGFSEGEFDATVHKNYDLSVIESRPRQPMALEVLPDLSVLYIERTGAIKRIDQKTGLVNVIGTIDVTTDKEDGLLGIVLDPDFAINNWIYLFYSPAGTVPKQHVSRFTLVDGKLDYSSEKIILEIKNQRIECCHSGGDLQFDRDGNLLITVGDNTNPFSTNYAPLDERPNRKYFDAQGTSANTKDLRGKILRIKPTVEGSYTIPEGNLFSDTSLGRPEIYIMGCRNPFRMAIDKETNTLYWGEVGPDAGSDYPGLGPKGYDEINRTDSAGNFGWPYCIADNKPYFNLTTKLPFNCEKPQNNSPNNYGIKNLPPSKTAWIWYPYGPSIEFPEFGTDPTRTAMAGAVYKYSDTSKSEVKFPEYYHNKIIIYEWTRNTFFEITTTPAGEIVKINPFLSQFTFSRPIDMTFGPDGAMYIINWGTDFWGAGSDSKIVKIGFIQKGLSPKAIIEASATEGNTPLRVKFSAEKSYDPDPEDKLLRYSWDVNGDGTVESTDPLFEYTFTEKGSFKVILRVTDSAGNKGLSQQEIIAGNNKPVIQIAKPLNGGFYQWGDHVDFSVKVFDIEDGSTDSGEINCTDLLVEPSIGHDDHAHGAGQFHQCEGTFETNAHGDGQQNVYYTLDAVYRDKGEADGIGLTGYGRSILNPKKMYGSYYKDGKGISIENQSSLTDEGPYLTKIENSSYIIFNPVNLTKINFLTFKAKNFVSKPGSQFLIDVILDSLDGKIIARRKIDSSMSVLDYYTVEIPEIEGTHKLYIKFSNLGIESLKNIFHSIEFHGQGVAKTDPEKSKGLRAVYDLPSKKTERKDPMVSFAWEDGIEGGFYPVGPGKITWKGILNAPETGEYKLQTVNLGGAVKLWINDSLVIDKKQDGIASSNNFFWEANRKSKIQLEYIRNTGAPALYLKWKIPGSNFKTIHTTFLSLPEDCAGIPDGSAFVDSCGLCAGGSTGIVPTIDKSVCVTSINEKEDIFFTISPNPASGNVINVNSKISASYVLYTLEGKLVKIGKMEKGINTINTEGFSKGVYLIQVNDEKRVTTKKITIN